MPSTTNFLHPPLQSLPCSHFVFLMHSLLSTAQRNAGLRSATPGKQEPIIFIISLHKIQPMDNILHMNYRPTKRRLPSEGTKQKLTPCGPSPSRATPQVPPIPISLHVSLRPSSTILASHYHAASCRTTQHHVGIRSTSPQHTTQHHATSHALHVDIYSCRAT